MGISQGNERFSELFADLQAPLTAMLTARLGNTDDALDILQDTFLRFTELPVDNDIEDARAYVWKIARNLSVDEIRTRARQTRLLSRDDDAIDQARANLPSIDEQVHYGLCNEKIDALLKELSPECRRAFHLSRHHGLAYPDIARIMGVSTNMVKKHVVKALSVLRAGMQGYV
jgi:RNA polymerase sigma-70 factor (ECF subfamily)